MAVNRHRNHLVVYLEDQPYRGMMNGVKKLLKINDFVIDVRPPCGGWTFAVSDQGGRNDDQGPRGQLDEALKIRQTEQLPVYEKLGDVRSLLVGRTNLALLLWQMDAAANAARVQELLCLALTDARRLQIPEARIIENILSQRGLSCDGEAC